MNLVALALLPFQRRFYVCAHFVELCGLERECTGVSTSANSGWMQLVHTEASAKEAGPLHSPRTTSSNIRSPLVKPETQIPACHADDRLMMPHRNVMLSIAAEGCPRSLTESCVDRNVIVEFKIHGVQVHELLHASWDVFAVGVRCLLRV